MKPYMVEITTYGVVMAEDEASTRTRLRTATSVRFSATTGTPALKLMARS
jgi:hypothetical protein